MHSQTSTQSNQDKNLSSINQNHFGSLTILESGNDVLYRQIVAREKEFVIAIPPVSILLDRGYLNIELLIPGISKQNCKLGNHGLLLWVEVKKTNSLTKKEDSFHWTFIIPDNLNIREATAGYQPDGKLLILIPAHKKST